MMLAVRRTPLIKTADGRLLDLESIHQSDDIEQQQPTAGHYGMCRWKESAWCHSRAGKGRSRGNPSMPTKERRPHSCECHRASRAEEYGNVSIGRAGFSVSNIEEPRHRSASVGRTTCSFPALLVVTPAGFDVLACASREPNTPSCGGATAYGRRTHKSGGDRG